MCKLISDGTIWQHVKVEVEGKYSIGHIAVVTLLRPLQGKT